MAVFFQKLALGRIREPRPRLYLLLILDGFLSRNYGTLALSLIIILFAVYLRPGEPVRVHSDDAVPGLGHVAIHGYACSRPDTSKLCLEDETLFFDSVHLPGLWNLVEAVSRARRGHLLFDFS